ncbi:hypothetical protein D9M70_581710 [compost metagenome]
MRVGLGCQVKLVVIDDAVAVAQGARLQLLFGRRLIGIPDHPGIDTAALKRGAGISRRQEHRLDIGVFEAGILQGAHQQVMHVGPLVQRDFLALEFLH